MYDLIVILPLFLWDEFPVIYNNLIYNLKLACGLGDGIYILFSTMFLVIARFLTLESYLYLIFLLNVVAFCFFLPLNRYQSQGFET